MRRPISWSALTSASVGLWGLGVEGTASLQRLQSMGLQPVLVDDKVASRTSHGLPILRMSDGGLTALLGCDVVIKSPGISRYRPEVDTLERAGVRVCGGLGLWLEDADRQRVVCITGTKGKSTTSSLVAHLLTGLGYQARVGGNIGQPPWALTDDAAPDYWIIETSSFQVPDLTVAPPVVVVTSLSPDHLDWHGSVERYYADKLSLCTKPGVETALAPADDPLLRQLLHDVPTLQWIGDDLGGSWVDHLHLPGAHNARNAALARAVLLSLGLHEANDELVLAGAADGFSGLESRCHSIGHVGGVEFVDDGLSTNVLSVTAALEAFRAQPVALLVGGADRGIEYSVLGQALLARSKPTLVVTMPDSGPRIGQAITDIAGPAVEVIDAPDLKTAVTTAFGWCAGNGVVLLSPGAPSFGHFADYRHRGSAFAEAAASCGQLTPNVS